MEDIIISIILVLIIGIAIYYIVSEKKKGNTCIGCPSAGKCPKKQCNCRK
ncbi:MAG: FeoB-associated Cys-rich membrane protein [Lachnospiraceae bacterium]|nr:FeoB-associated Cys-rich membrane protein [Lachnospiraceae bacterium]